MYIFSITVYVGGSKRVPPDPTQSMYAMMYVQYTQNILLNLVIQWNLCNVDTLGPTKSVLLSKVS